MKQFDTHSNENIVMVPGGFFERKEDAKCSTSLTVSKRTRVPQMETEYIVRMQRDSPELVLLSTRDRDMFLSFDFSTM